MKRWQERNLLVYIKWVISKPTSRITIHLRSLLVLTASAGAAEPLANKKVVGCCCLGFGKLVILGVRSG
ncbi:hypothetical protein AV530_011099 [Patagioenas fasciata monilis]|uniref:Uncharacterized protein n=1 Tax=Patagioenas fasciata monilis TaxID=372326 RepID=A0A1V4JVT8_PATFA|nr:hypothetical protein AV530_011099 [Patagioenas fasciata monilis]